MDQALALVKIAALLALTALLCSATAVAIEIDQDLVVLQPKIAGALDSVKAIEKSTNDLEQSTYATEGEVANLADTMNGIAAGLASHETSDLQQAQDASKQLRTLLEHADTDIVGIRDVEQATTETIRSIGADSHTTLESARGVMTDAAMQVSNPAIAESLEDIRDSAINVRTSTAQINVATQQLSATATDVRQVADHWRAASLAPVSTAKKIGLAVAAFAGTFAGHFF